MNKIYFKILTIFVLLILCFPKEFFAQDKLEVNDKVGLKVNDVLDDTVNIAFGKAQRQHLIGATSFINTDAVIKYDNVQTISEAMLGRVPGLLGSNNIRGIGNALFIVDGLPRDVSN
ncbi:MAG: hypothetical protein PHD30_08260, partial [Paludibacter sp.]|nr:hypothetical protein [Paludibacter sp.]